MFGIITIWISEIKRGWVYVCNSMIHLLFLLDSKLLAKLFCLSVSNGYNILQRLRVLNINSADILC